MRKLFDGLYVHEDRMTLAGTNLLLRATFVRLSTGGIWVHSPTTLTPALRAEVDALGRVECIVAPSNGHNLWLMEWRDAYPAAKPWVARGIPKKIPKLAGYATLDAGSNPWAADFHHAVMPQVPFFDESVFLHRATKSLLVTDLIQNHDLRQQHGVGKLVAQLLFQPLGFKGICIAPPLRMGFPIKDRAAFATFLKTVGQWNFERIIVTHGDIVEEQPREVFARLSGRFTAP